jgi:hypothetical protein
MGFSSLQTKALIIIAGVVLRRAPQLKPAQK